MSFAIEELDVRSTNGPCDERSGTTAISSHQKVEIVEADMAVDHDHIRSMTVVFVTNGPMLGINLCERAVAVTIGLTNLEHEGVVAPAAG